MSRSKVKIPEGAEVVGYAIFPGKEGNVLATLYLEKNEEATFISLTAKIKEKNDFIKGKQ